MDQQTGSVRPSAGRARAASAVNTHFDTRTAATELAHSLHDALAGPCDLLVVFASFHHRAAFESAGDILRHALAPRALLGVTAESILGDDEEIEGRSGISALALSLPGVDLKPIHFYRENFHELLRDRDLLRAALEYGPDFRGLLLAADPFTTPMHQLLPALNAAGDAGHPVNVLGGLASGASKPGLNLLLLDELATAEGAVGFAISGAIEIDAVVSQGCRPIGKPFVITKAHDNIIVELGGRKALQAVQEMAEALPDEQRELLTRGLLLGVAINAAKSRFGRNDFLIRNVVGIDPKQGTIAVADLIRAGQTIQFHVRDAETADEDLRLLLDAQQLRESPPFAGLLFTCNGRGGRLFPEPHHDARLIRERLAHLPLAGFFAAGEIGPIGSQSFQHGHTASLALFREPARKAADAP